MSQKFGTRRQKAKEETRRIILETAYVLFEEKGYEKATMRELALRAGVGLGTIFQHFSYKSSLLIATFDEEMRPVAENAIATLPSKNLKKQLLHIVSHVFEFYARRVRLSRVLLKEIIFFRWRREITIPLACFEDFDNHLLYSILCQAKLSAVYCKD